MTDEKLIGEIADEIKKRHAEVFVVEAKIIRGSRTVISLLLDTLEGIKLSYCAQISREIGRWMEEEGKMEGAYVLEVSSPGIGSPLKERWQYDKNAGKNLQINTRDGREHRGELIEVTDQGILIRPIKSPKKKGARRSKKEEIIDLLLEFEEIAEAKVIII